jgi:hypothetical protein
MSRSTSKSKSSDDDMTWSEMGDKVLAGGALTRVDALAILQSPDGDLRDVVEAAFKVRLKHHGLRVNLHVLRNAKSGLCSEDCSFCSQSVLVESGVEQYRMQTVEEIVEGARDAQKLGAVKYCVVTSSRAPSPADLDVICRAVRAIRHEMKIRWACSRPTRPDSSRRRVSTGTTTTSRPRGASSHPSARRTPTTTASRRCARRRRRGWRRAAAGPSGWGRRWRTGWIGRSPCGSWRSRRSPSTSSIRGRAHGCRISRARRPAAD